MKKIKNKIIVIFTMLIITIFLSGCTRQEYNVVITEQNSVNFQVRVIIDKESYNLLSTFNVDINELEKNGVEGTSSAVDRVNPLFQETAMQFKNYGFDVTELNDAVELGFVAKKSYLTIEEFNAEIKTLCENNLSGLNLDIQYVDTKNKKEYKAYGTLDYVIDKDLGFDDEIIKGYFDKQYDTSALTCKALIRVPATTQITASDGTASQNGSLEWVTSYDDGQKEVHVISEYHDNSIYYIIALIIIVIIGIVAFFIIRAMKFKKEKENSALRDEYEYEQTENQ